MKLLMICISVLSCIVGSGLAALVFMNRDIVILRSAGKIFPILLTGIYIYRMIISIVIITAVSPSVFFLAERIRQILLKENQEKDISLPARYFLSALHLFLYGFIFTASRYRGPLSAAVFGYIITYTVFFSVVDYSLHRSLKKQRFLGQLLYSLILLIFVIWALYVANAVFSFGRIVD